MSSSTPVHYADYLQLGALLHCQKPESFKRGRPAHDEMLFIITHQTYELWFKQIHFELDSLLKIFQQNSIHEGQMGKIVERMKRIHLIFQHLVKQLDILETMTPSSFLEFRQDLAPASGFQSVQFRALEIKLGLPIQSRPAQWPHYIYAQLKDHEREYLSKLEQAPSLKDYLVLWLERSPFLESEQFSFWKDYEQAVQKMFTQEKAFIEQNAQLPREEQSRQLNEWENNKLYFSRLFDSHLFHEFQETGGGFLGQKATLAALFIFLYSSEPLLLLPHQFLHSLMDLDEVLSSWRYRHALLAHRMLGKKVGTGGSLGHSYLKSTADGTRLFNDLYNLSTFLIPQSFLPPLPDSMKKRLNFQAE